MEDMASVEDVEMNEAADEELSAETVEETETKITIKNTAANTAK